MIKTLRERKDPFFLLFHPAEDAQSIRAQPPRRRAQQTGLDGVVPPAGLCHPSRIPGSEPATALQPAPGSNKMPGSHPKPSAVADQGCHPSREDGESTPQPQRAFGPSPAPAECVGPSTRCLRDKAAELLHASSLFPLTGSAALLYLVLLQQTSVFQK